MRRVRDRKRDSLGVQCTANAIACAQLYPWRTAQRRPQSEAAGTVAVLARRSAHPSEHRSLA
jgi:hypothetical protein